MRPFRLKKGRDFWIYEAFTMIGRLNHVAIVVPDLAAATALYRDTLGAQLRLFRDDHPVKVLIERFSPLVGVLTDSDA